MLEKAHLKQDVEQASLYLHAILGIYVEKKFLIIRIKADQY